MESRVQPPAAEDSQAQAPAEGACGLNPEIARLRLTDAEREAVSEAIAAFDEFAGDEVYVRTLRGLLERMR